MPQPHYSVKQEDHQKFICLGLSGLQQNEDLVDMTIAADGYFVKVHKIVMSVASPYFRQIIAGTDGHPVLYLNKVSYATLGSILEYIYHGESRIEDDKLDEFIQVSKDLQINGLKDLIPQSDLRKPYNLETNNYEDKDVEAIDKEKSLSPISTESIHESETIPIPPNQTTEEGTSTNPIIISDQNGAVTKENEIDASELPQDKAKVQFTISNQGTLQAIFNRYIYNQCYVYKKNKNLRQWRCFQSRKPSKCPATMVTEHDKIIKRSRVHNHPFHDNNILKKLRKHSIFAAIKEAQTHISKSKASRVNSSESE